MPGGYGDDGDGVVAGRGDAKGVSEVGGKGKVVVYVVVRVLVMMMLVVVF